MYWRIGGKLKEEGSESRKKEIQFNSIPLIEIYNYVAYVIKMRAHKIKIELFQSDSSIT